MLLIKQPLIEVIAVIFILLASLVVLSWAKPWLTRTANLVGVAVTFAILLTSTVVLGLVALELKSENQSEEDKGCGTPRVWTLGADSKILNELVFVGACTALTLLVVAIFIPINKSLQVRKEFGAFLCHH